MAAPDTLMDDAGATGDEGITDDTAEYARRWVSDSLIQVSHDGILGLSCHVWLSSGIPPADLRQDVSEIKGGAGGGGGAVSATAAPLCPAAQQGNVQAYQVP